MKKNRFAKLCSLALAAALALGGCAGNAQQNPSSNSASSANPPAASSGAPASSSAPAASSAAPAASGGAAAVKPSGYPQGGTVTVVCGYAAGGAQDNNCRAAAQFASQLSGDNYVVTNIEGSSGRVAAADVTASKADGQKLYLAAITFVSEGDFQYLDPNALESQMATNIVVAEGFDAICGLHNDSRSLTIRADDDRFSDLAGFLSYVEAHPGELTIGTPGAASSGGLMAQLMVKKLGLDINVVNYTSTAEVHAALLGGHVDAEMSALSAASNDGDTAKTIGCAGAERSDLFPDVPTFVETGYDLSIPITRCMLVKKGTDPAIINYLSTLFSEMAENQDYIDLCMNTYGSTVDYVPSAECQTNIQACYDAYLAAVG